jgi:hypothetical protein
MKWGMKFAETGKPVSDDRNLIYTTERDQLKYDLKADPTHVKYFDRLPNMRNLTTYNTVQGQLDSEIIFQMKHNMPFKPSVSAYLQVIDTPVDYAYYIGTYVTDFLRLGGSLLYVDADDTYVYLKHDKYHNFNIGTPSTQTETDMDKFNIRCKLLVSNARFTGQVQKVTGVI